MLSLSYQAQCFLNYFFYWQSTTRRTNWQHQYHWIAWKANTKLVSRHSVPWAL
jgi:hypothetical protein